jgi:hypothetical protein
MMMKTITKVLSLTACLFLLTTVFAQNVSKPEDRAKKITEWMKTKLSLTGQQIPQVSTLNLKYANSNQQTKDNSSLSPLAKLKKLTDNQTNKDAELQKLLKPEQFKIYQAKKAELEKFF